MHASLATWPPTVDCIRQRISQVRIGPRQHVRRLTIFPLLAPPLGAPALPLAAALRGGQVELREHDRPSVPSLRLVNHGPQPVLVLAGEQVIGGGQDRLLGADAVVAARGRAALPAVCAEAGRWRVERPSFLTDGVAPASLRRLIAGADEAGEQAAIWDEIGRLRRVTSAPAPTGALRDLFAHRAALLAEYEAALPRATPGACGLAVAIAGRVVALDLFAQPALLAAAWRPLVRAAALEAVDARGPDAPAPLPLVSAALRAASTAEAVTRRAPAGGLAARLQAGSLRGSALIDADVVHLALFPEPANTRCRRTGALRRVT